MERPSARRALDGSSRMVIPPQSTSEIALGARPKEEIVLPAIADPNPQGISARADGGFLERSPRRVTQTDDRGPHRSGSAAVCRQGCQADVLDWATHGEVVEALPLT